MKNVVTVMIEDNWIVVDDITVWFRKKIKTVPGHERLWALHWKEGSGEYQLDNPSENHFFDSSQYDQYVQPYVDQFDEELAWIKQEEERLKREAEEEYNKPENVEARAREHRNKLLEETDYILMPDYPISEEQRALWVEYRQALRDLPDQSGWPTNIVWPVKPGTKE